MKSTLTKDVLPDSVPRFWEWFADNQAALAMASVPDSLVVELEARLFAICKLDWEIGPGRNAPNMLALSPRGDPGLLQLTRGIVAQAPPLSGWEFHPAKPPRTWNLVFTLEKADSRTEIDAKLWEFVLYKFRDGTFDLLLKPERNLALPEDYLGWAAIIIADGEIGEETRMERISTLEVVNSWDDKSAKNASKLEPGLLAKLMSLS